MKAVSIREPGVIDLLDRETPIIDGSGQVIIKIKCTGICGSDVGMYQGHNPFIVYPRIYGHEFTGTVCAMSDDVTGLELGQHVVGEPIDYCGECYACRNGHPNVCEHLLVYGVHLDGGGQEYIRMPASRVHPIQKEVPFRCAVLAEPMTIGFRACNRADVRKGDMILIQGAGTIGLCCLLAAKAREATVIITDVFDEKLEYAQEMGADFTINCKEKNMINEVLRITEDRGANVIFDCVGNKKSLEDSIDVASVAGRIVELGMSDRTSEVNHMKICRRDLTLLGTRLQAHEFPEAIDFVEKNWERLENFVTKEFSVDEAKEAFDYTIENGRENRKTLINFD